MARQYLAVGSDETLAGSHKGDNLGSFDAPLPKPTRFLATLKACRDLPHATWPVFSEDSYLGPLPTSCGHSTHAKRLLGQLPSGKWATEGSAAYPPALCKYLAGLIAGTVGGSPELFTRLACWECCTRSTTTCTRATTAAPYNDRGPTSRGWDR